MLYDVVVNGAFENVDILFTEFIFPLNIKCLSCGIKHKKTLTVSGSNGGTLSIKCVECDSELTCKIIPPSKSTIEGIENKIGDKIYESVKINNGFLILKVEMRGALLIEVPLYEVYVKSGDEVHFAIINKEEIWSKMRKDKEVVSIEGYSVDIIEIK